jgi:hypothetical protein
MPTPRLTRIGDRAWARNAIFRSPSAIPARLVAVLFGGTFLVEIRLATATVRTGPRDQDARRSQTLDRPAARQMQPNPLQADPGAKGPDRNRGAAVNPLV